MRPLGLTSLAALLVGCASPNGALDEGRYVTTYYDRKYDGLVDFELHDIPRASDDAWALSDTKFSGRYDVRLKFGYAFERERVDMPVLRDVPITPGKPPSGIHHEMSVYAVRSNHAMERTADRCMLHF